MIRLKKKLSRRFILIMLVVGMLCVMPGAPAGAGAYGYINLVTFRGPVLEPYITYQSLLDSTYKLIPGDLGGSYENVGTAVVDYESGIMLGPLEMLGEHRYQFTYSWMAPYGYAFAANPQFVYQDFSGKEYLLTSYTYFTTGGSDQYSVIEGTIVLDFRPPPTPTPTSPPPTPVPTPPPPTPVPTPPPPTPVPTPPPPTPTPTPPPTPAPAPSPPTPTPIPEPEPAEDPTPEPEPGPDEEDSDELVRKIVFHAPPLAPGQLPTLIQDGLDCVEPRELTLPGGWRAEILDVDSFRAVPRGQPLRAQKYRLQLFWTGLPGVKTAPPQEIYMFYNDLMMTSMSAYAPGGSDTVTIEGLAVFDLTGVEPLFGRECFFRGGDRRVMSTR